MEKNVGKQNPERERNRYSKEFKLEAVRLLELGQKPATELALELGIARNQLYKWQAQLGKVGKEQAFHGPGRKLEDERSENERLRAELKRVTEERDILKKATAYFARNCREVRVHCPTSSAVPPLSHVPGIDCFAQRIL
jgi:transposase